MISTPRTTGPLVIRTALPSEAAAITELHARARSTYYPDGLPFGDVDWVAAWRGSIERPEAHVLCAVRDGHLVGIASFRRADDAPADTVKLFQFHVDPDCWRQGIGRALHSACLNSGGPTASTPPPSTCTSTTPAPGLLRPPGLGPGPGEPARRRRSPPLPALRRHRTKPAV